MWVSAAICDDSIWFAHSFESVPDIRRNYHKRVVVRSKVDLHYCPFCWGGFSLVIEYKLDAAKDAGVVQSHVAMSMPAFHDTRVDR